MEIVKVHQDIDTPLEKSTSIKEARSAIERARLALSELEKAKATAKAEVTALHELLPTVRDPDIQRIKEFIWKLYWEEDWINVPAIKAIAISYFGKDHKTWKDLIEGRVAAACTDCKQEVSILVASRSHYQRIKAGKNEPYKPLLCEKCQQEKNKMRQQQQAEWDTHNKARALRIQELQNMPYGEYLQTEEWNQTRQAALKRAKYACQLCNADHIELHVHHRTYERLGQEYARDLIVLCKQCHSKFHDKTTGETHP